MLQLSNVSKIYGTHTVFDDVSLKISPSSRIGLVGRNGAGKSTMFKLMTGEITPEKGTISRMPNTTIKCLTQEPQITEGNTLMQEVMSAFPSNAAADKEEEELLAKWGDFTEEQQLDACERLAELGSIKDQMGHLEADASRMLLGLSFSLDEFDQKVEQFSGGWQMRINLAKILLQKPDFLLLDEPTNHLDLEAREWLEEFLKNYPGGLLIVTHDRQFLDRVVTEVAEIELGRLTVWPGNYTKALERKAEALEKLRAAAERQRKELEKQQEFIDRFRASATKSTQAKSREKQLAKVERIEPPETDKSRMHVRFPEPPQSELEVLTLRGLKKAYGDNVLYTDLNAMLERKQRVFLLGANGTGKTTLLRLILGLEEHDGGELNIGGNTDIGYFSQHQLETLNPEHTVLRSLEEAAPIQMDQTEVRGVLGRFLFTGDRVDKKVKVLSGGEKSRLALARLVLGKNNFLLLDEPTNHMDIPAQLVMESAFKSFAGSILCISHDRYLIQQVATDIWELYKGEIICYNGDYDYYLQKRSEFRALADTNRLKKGGSSFDVIDTPKAKTGRVKAKKMSPKQVAKIEKDIATQETLIADLHRGVNAAGSDHEKMQRLSGELQAAEGELASLNAQWESALEQV